MTILTGADRLAVFWLAPVGSPIHPYCSPVNTVIFEVLGSEGRITSGFGHGRTPVEGEFVIADGTDDELPRGTYQVICVYHIVGLRGPSAVICVLNRKSEKIAGGRDALVDQLARPA